VDNQRLAVPSAVALEISLKIADNMSMIDRGIHGKEKRTKALGSESVHGLPQEWPELQQTPRSARRHRDALLATQNVHGIPTDWDELDLSE
jgi:hypothetical protein